MLTLSILSAICGNLRANEKWGAILLPEKLFLDKLPPCYNNLFVYSGYENPEIP